MSSVHPDTANKALAASLHMYDEESDRSKQVEQKATTILGASGVSLTVLLAFGKESIKTLGSIHYASTVLAIALVSLFSSFIFAFLVLKTRKFQRAQLDELLSQSALLMKPEEYAWRLAVTYERAITWNKSENDGKARHLSLSLWSSLIALVSIAILMIYYAAISHVAGQNG